MATLGARVATRLATRVATRVAIRVARVAMVAARVDRLPQWLP